MQTSTLESEQDAPSELRPLRWDEIAGRADMPLPFLKYFTNEQPRPPATHDPEPTEVGR